MRVSERVPLFVFALSTLAHVHVGIHRQTYNNRQHPHNTNIVCCICSSLGVCISVNFESRQQFLVGTSFSFGVQL